MPFPFAVGIGAAIVGGLSTLGTAVTLGAVAAGTTAAVIGGSVVVGGAIATAAAISSYNNKKREEAAEAARRQASRERERQLLEQKREQESRIKALQDEYGEKIPEEKIKPLMEDRFVTLAELEGNSRGLRDRGETPDEEAAKASDELDALKKEAGLAA